VSSRLNSQCTRWLLRLADEEAALHLVPRALIEQLDRGRSASLMTMMDAYNALFRHDAVMPARAGLTEKHT
jgi:hypothetical protein